GYNLRLPSGYVPAGMANIADRTQHAAFHLPGPARGLVFEVEHLAGLHGRVVEADGRPLAQAEVNGRFWSESGSFDQGAHVEENGTFELFPLRSWRRVEFEY